VWDTVSKTCITTLRDELDIYSLCLSPQRRRLFSGSTDVKVWDTETWQCVHTLEGHNCWVKSLVLDESANRLYSTDSGTIKVWDLDTLTCIRTLQAHRNRELINCLALSVTSNRLYSGSDDETIKAWNTVSFGCVGIIHVKSKVLSLCLSEDGSRLYCGSRNLMKDIRVYDTATNKCIAYLSGHNDIVTALCFSSKTKQLISASYDATIRVWDTTTNKCIHAVKHISPIWSLALSDNNDTLYSAGGGKCLVKAWEFKHAFKRPSDLEIG
jgi:WD40 repeat protein